jgi:uncharacterized membrane protein YcaP (DUF421 family)
MLNTIIKTIIIYFSVMIVMRMMGKRQVGELQPFDLVIAIIIAEVAATPLDQAGTPIAYGIAPIITLLFFHNLIAFIILKSSKIRRVVSGKPSIVISKGIVDMQVLKSIDFNLNDLMELLRTKDVFDISCIDYALIEPNGSISVLLKAKKMTPTIDDMSLSYKNKGFSYILIADGKADHENMEFLKIDESKLKHLLKKNGHIHTKDVFYLCVNECGDVIMQTENGKIYSLNGALKSEAQNA